MDKEFKLHWLDGKTEIIKGENIANAFMKAGLGEGSLSALDYYEQVTPKEEKSVVPALLDVWKKMDCATTEMVAIRAFLLVIDERIAGYRVMKDLNICANDFIKTWESIKQKVKDGSLLEGDSQAGDLFAKVYGGMALPRDFYQEIFLKHFRPFDPAHGRPCGNPKCTVSTGMAEELTFGSGKLCDNGYWEVPCKVCARAAEKKDGVPLNSYWPFDKESQKK